MSVNPEQREKAECELREIFLWVKNEERRVRSENPGRKGLDVYARVCLKNHSRNLHAPLCVLFVPKSVHVARYDSLFWNKSSTKWVAHLTKSNFQTRSREDKEIHKKMYEKIKTVKEKYPDCGDFTLNQFLIQD